MASRISLLILVTGAFAVIWSGDKPDQIAAVDRPARVLMGRADTRNPNELIRTAAREPRSQDDVKSVNHATKTPLPRGITPGTYLVVDKSGRTETRIIQWRDAIAAGSTSRTPNEDHFVVQSERGRWHYIRIETTVPAENALTSAITPSIE